MKKSESSKIITKICSTPFLCKAFYSNDLLGDLLNWESKRKFSDKDMISLIGYFNKEMIDYWNKEKIDVDFYKRLFVCKNAPKYRDVIININKQNIFERIIKFNHLILAERLIDAKFNKELVYNFLINHESQDFFSIPSVAHLLLLKKYYAESRILKLIDTDYGKDLKYELSEINSLVRIVKRDFSIEEISDYRIFPKKPKSFKEIHDRLDSKIKERKLMNGVKDFPLQPREDLLIIDGKKLNYKDNDWVVRIAKTKMDLVRFSQSSVFSNCVGTSDTYGKKAEKGLVTIIGIFTSNNKPLYCIETGVYSFTQARGVGNSIIPTDVYNALQELLTQKPYLPEDFIEMKNSFIYGYKYDPENNKMYVSFKRGAIYCYQDVDNESYEIFANSKSKGSCLNKLIKKFAFVKME